MALKILFLHYKLLEHKNHIPSIFVPPSIWYRVQHQNWNRIKLLCFYKIIKSKFLAWEVLQSYIFNPSITWLTYTHRHVGIGLCSDIICAHLQSVLPYSPWASLGMTLGCTACLGSDSKNCVLENILDCSGKNAL